MKKNQVLVALMAVVLVITSMFANMPMAKAGSVYAPKTLTATTGSGELDGKFTFDEILYLKGDESIIPTSTYSFSINTAVNAFTGGGTVSYGLASTVTVPTDRPAITASVNFDNSMPTITDSTGKFISKPVEVDLSGITFTEPGIYYWKGTKTLTSSATNQSNHRDTFFVVVRVEDQGGNLKIASKGIVHKGAGDYPGNAGKVDRIEDEYPATTHNVTLTKEVSGSQASRSQYFKFVVNIMKANVLAGTNATVAVGSATGTPADVLYGETASYTNPTTIAIDASGAGNAEFWLKHGDSITIKDLPDGAAYTIVESEYSDTGYTPSIDVTGDTYTSKTTDTLVDDKLESDATVKYTNTKDSSTPTGIILEIAAPVAGIVLALALLAVVMLSKKRSAARR